MKKILIVMLATLLIISACAPAPTKKYPGLGVETIVAATVQAMTPVPLPTAQPTIVTVSGIPVSFNNVTFTIPLELNASVSSSTSTDVEFPYINPSGGPMAEHVVFQMTNFPIAGDVRIMVFKTSDYASYGPPTQNAVTALLAKQDSFQPLPKALAQDFYAQAKTVTFKNGHGVRYLSQVMTSFAPITNSELFYYYQGVTNDGAYFVSARFPVNTAFLTADGKNDSPVPADGIPFPADAGGPGVFSKYLDQVTQKLNSTTPENYTPSLAILDKVIESIQVANP